MSKKSLRKFIGIISTIIIVMTIMFSNVTLAVENLNNNSGNLVINDENYKESLYSEQYKAYLNLSEEEKAKVKVVPRKYNIPLKNLEIKENEEKPSLFNLFGLVKSSTLPSSYDLRDDINIQVENQDTNGLCWDFASLKSLETYMLLNGYGDYDYSETHVDYMLSDIMGYLYDGAITRKLNDGGNFDMFKDYLGYLYGPVYESEVPYNTKYETDEEIEYLLSLDPKAYVTETVEFPTIQKDTITYTESELKNFRDSVKEHIQENGSLYASINSTQIKEVNGKQTLYNTNQNLSDHAISIIGWDDNFKKENFKDSNGNTPKNNGAYIALNSWGDSWGDNGIFYISYEDILVETELSGIKAASETLSYEEIHFNDVNLYNAIIEELGDRVIEKDDSNLTIKITQYAIDNVEYLYLNDKNITDLTGLEHFKNIFELELNNNNLVNIDAIKELENLEYFEADNSNLDNQIIENLAGLSNLTQILLNNNNITDISKLSNKEYIYRLELSNNENLNFNTIPLDKIEYLIIQNCNITDISAFQNFSSTYLTNLDLSNNPISDLSYIDWFWGRLRIINTNVSDVSNLTELSGLSVSGEVSGIYSLDNLSYLEITDNNSIDLTKLSSFPNLENLVINNCNLKNINDIPNLKIKVLDLSYNNLEDISGISKLSEIEELYLSYNNISNYGNIINQLKNVDTLKRLYLDNNNITSLINDNKAFKNLNVLDLSYNNITDLTGIENTTEFGLFIELGNNKISDISKLKDVNGLYYANIENNCIENIPEEYIDDFLDINTMGNQNITKELTFQFGEEGNIELPQIIEYAHKHRAKINTENCDIDYENNKVIVNSAVVGNGQAKVEITTGNLKGSILLINYNCTNSTIDKSGIKVTTASSKIDYIEGESFDSTGMVVELLDVSGNTTGEIKNYTILDGDNLQYGQKTVTIKYGSYTTTQKINVYSKDLVEKITFNENNMLKTVYDNIIDLYGTNSIKYIDGNSIILTKKQLEEITCLDLNLNIEKVTDITGLSKFYNLKSLNLYGGEFSDVSEIGKLINLEDILDIRCNKKIKDISCFTNLTKLNEICLFDTGVKNIDCLKNLNNLERILVNGLFTEDEIEKIDNKIVIPKYISDYDVQEGVTYYDIDINDEDSLFWLYLEDNPSNTQIIKDKNNYVVELDKEVNKEKPYGDRALTMKYITEKEEISFTVTYKPSELYVTSEEYEIKKEEKNTYMYEIKPNTTLLNFISNCETNGTLTVYKKDGNILGNNEVIGTGMVLKGKLNNEEITITLGVKGDTNGNGRIDTGDLTAIRGHLYENRKLEGIYLHAMDLDKNNSISTKDLTTIRGILYEGKSI